MPLIMQYKAGTGAPPSGGGSTTPDCTAPHFLDNTYWTNNSNCFWDGTKWLLAVGGATFYILDVTGAWATGYRPSTMEIKFYKDSSGISTDSWELQVFDTNSDPISSVYDLGPAYALDTVHSLSIPLTFGSFDLNRIAGDNFLYNNGSQIRCIKFT